MMRLVTALALIASSLVPAGAGASGFEVVGNVALVSRAKDRLFVDGGRRGLEPFGHVVFCAAHPAECPKTGTLDSVEATEARLRELDQVNRTVNRRIASTRDDPAKGAGDLWTLSPLSGDCEDYAVTKRHELVALGWPPSVFRLAVGKTSWGETHLVLVVRTDKGDLVLDSLDGRIRSWDLVNMQWDLIQDGRDPHVWLRIDTES